MKIVKNYERKNDDKVKEGTQKCPKCHEDIPKSEWTNHMKLELMNPKWREEKQKLEERKKLNSLASDEEIAQNVKKFTNEKRDIFGK